MSPSGARDLRPSASGVGVVASRGGTSPHLVDLALRKDRSLCGVEIEFGAPCASFGMAGCKKCARLAIGRGLAEISDIDAEVVLLDDVLERAW